MAGKERIEGQEKPSQSEEEKIEKQLRLMTENIEVPDKLRPEEVERILSEKRHVKKRRMMWKYIGGTAAACICLALGIAIGYRVIRPDECAGDNSGNVTSVLSEAENRQQQDSGAGQSEVAGAGDYDEIYGYIKADSQSFKWDSQNSGIIVEDSMTSAAQGTDMAAEKSFGSYSDTNVREDGVGEGDIVKTDGKYLYVMNEAKITIVGIESAGMEKTAEIIPEMEGYFSELYVEGNLLAAVYSCSTQSYVTEDSSSIQKNDGRDDSTTSVFVYDISDASDPQQIGTFTQSGYYNTMRIRDGYVYLISNFYAGMPAAPTDRTVYIPQVQDALLEPGDIYVPTIQSGREYTLISAFAMDNPAEATDSAAVLGSGGQCYVSGNNIYITEEIYYGTDGVTQTSIRRLSYNRGYVAAEAQTKVAGTLKDSFSIDEYEGYLRLVTTVSPVYTAGNGVQPVAETGDGESTEASPTSPAEADTNSLYVLDENLEVVGEITDLAPDESVYSARFMGDVGYFVTFRQVDPLFSVDLSDPENPEIIGELKIPGFSEYLHPYGDELLLGIGMDMDEEAVAAEGVKLSMFDISDPKNVQETDAYVMENIYGTDAAYNYKAVFVDIQKNLFGFTAWSENINRYYIFTFDEKQGFQEIFTRELPGWGEIRGLYAGERFYIVSGSMIESYTLDGFEKIDDIVL